MVIGQEIELALGLPINITGFIDGKPRKCHPYKLINLYRLNTYLSCFDHVNMGVNLEKEISTTAMLDFVAESFPESTAEDLFKNINSEMFPEIIADIKFVHGVIDSDGEKDLDSSKEAVNWGTSINALITYTGSTFDQIKDMTLNQFSSLLTFVGKKINWEYKTNILSIVSEPNDYIETEDHPLSSKKIEKKKHMTMSDVMEISQQK